MLLLPLRIVWFTAVVLAIAVYAQGSRDLVAGGWPGQDAPRGAARPESAGLEPAGGDE